MSNRYRDLDNLAKARVARAGIAPASTAPYVPLKPRPSRRGFGLVETRMVTRKQHRDAVTAYHEAGHAVARAMLGMPLRHATIIPTDDSRGHVESPPSRAIRNRWDNCNGDPLSDPVLAQWIEHEIIATMAGPIAQHCYAPRSRLNDTFAYVELTTAPPVLHLKPNRRMARAGSDTQIIMRYIDDLHGAGRVAEHYYLYLDVRTTALVDAHWKKIERVAQALLKHKTLSDDQVRAAMFPDFVKNVA